MTIPIKWATIRVRDVTRQTIKIAAASADIPMSELVDDAVKDWLVAHQVHNPSRRHR